MDLIVELPVLENKHIPCFVEALRIKIASLGMLLICLMTASVCFVQLNVLPNLLQPSLWSRILRLLGLEIGLMKYFLRSIPRITISKYLKVLSYCAVFGWMLSPTRKHICISSNIF